MKRAKALYTLLGALIGLIHIVPFYVLITTSFKEELDTSSKWVMPGYLFFGITLRMHGSSQVWIERL